jgi:hypothetical protein
MMAGLIRETEHLPDDEFIEIRYEKLEQSPLAEIKRVYETFDLPGFATARPAFESYLVSIRTYKKNRYAFSEKNLRLVEREWGCYLDRWQYQRPPAASSERADRPPASPC